MTNMVSSVLHAWVGKARATAGECQSGDPVGRAWSVAVHLVVETVSLMTEEFWPPSSLLGLFGLPGPRAWLKQMICGGSLSL